MMSHRQSGSPEYRVWSAMLGRCSRVSAKDYPRYGGRGISVCERWKSFENFLADVGPRPSPAHSLDRKNNAGNYEPGNVQWATLLEQANNKRTNHVVIYRGEETTIANAARIAAAGVPRETATCRIRNGWTVERAVETPLLFRRDPATRKKLIAAE